MMRSIRKKDTRPELVVRKLLHAMGARFRLHRADLPGTPDIVLPRRRMVIQVHGCFWHQHPGCPLAKRPRSRPEYWHPKLARNIERDMQSQKALQKAGWRVLVIWECQTKHPERMERRLSRALARSHRCRG